MIVTLIITTVKVSKINAKMKLTRLLPYRYKDGNPGEVPDFENNSCIQQLLLLFLNERLEFWMHFSYLMLECFFPFLYRYDVLDNMGVLCF